jgi:hypothetical protein
MSGLGAALVSLLCGCAGTPAPKPPSAAQLRLVARANGICAEFNKHVEALKPPVGRAHVAEFATTLQRAREAELVRLHALTAEAGVPHGYATFVTNLGALDRLYAGLVEGLNSGQSEVPASVSEEGSSVADAIARDEAGLKLSECAKNPSASTQTSSSEGSGSAAP